MAEQPKNLRNVDSKHLKKRRASDNLPVVNRTKLNTEFLSATLDHLIQPQLSTEIEGYIGSKPSYYNPTRDFYIPEQTSSREFYQLTTALVQRNHETFAIENTLFYDDLINYLRFNGGLIDNHERLFSQSYYSWQPPIDLDKFLNFRNYYWVESPSPYIIGQSINKFTGDALVDSFNIPMQIESNADLSVVVDYVEVPVFDPNQTQTAWYKLDANNVKIFPTPNFGSEIEIILTSSTASNIDALVGEEYGTLTLYGSSNLILSSGMRIKITNDVNSAYNGKIFIVEGIGRAIYFIEDKVNTANWDMTSWDTSGWDKYVDVSVPDYVTIERGVENRWSRYNRWFHRDVLQNFYDKSITKIRAERPIIEFERGMELFNFGVTKKQDIDLIVKNSAFLEALCKITETGFNYVSNGYIYTNSVSNPMQMVWKHPDFDIEVYDTSSQFSTTWELKEYGFSNVHINGYTVYSGMRILDNDKIYTIRDIENGNIIPMLDSVDDPTEGDMTLVLSSNTDYWFNGTAWVKSQQKTSTPLFNLYNEDEIILNDKLEYPKSDFAGSKIFSYKLGDGVNDNVLGIPLAYDNFGEIIFDNNLVSDEYSYMEITTKRTISGFKYFKNDSEYVNNWFTVPYKSPQKYTQRFVNKNDNTLFRLKMTLRNLPYSGDYLIVKVDNKQLLPAQFSIQGNILRILPEIVLGSKEIEVNMIGDLVDSNEQDYFVDEFEYVDSNTFKLQEKPITPLTNDTIRVFVNGTPIASAQLSIVDDVYLTINHAFTAGDEVLVAIYIPKQQANDNSFWNIPSNLEANALNKDFDQLSRGDYFNHFSTAIARQENFVGNPLALNNYRDTKKIKFLGENILQHSAPMAKLMYLVSNDKVDMLKSIQYVEREFVRFKNKFIQQISNIRTTGELSNTDPISLWIQTALSKINLGKTQDFPFFNSGAIGELTWVPPTPAFLGIFAKYSPEIFVEEINFESTIFIRGHDGSLVLGFGDIRDSVLLEFEQQIYNSIRTEQHFDITGIWPGKLRQTDYSIEEIKTVMQPIIERWASTNAADYRKNSTYDAANPFTFNYTGSLDLSGERVFGSWRSIYKWFFDTDKLNTHPWEALHFSEKPTWWEAEYGEAPYTSGNTKLWEDIGEGRIRSGDRAGVHAELKRTTQTYTIWDILPVGAVGELLDPIAAGIIPSIPNSAQAGANWEVLDNGPVESVWTNSENYPFVLSQLAFLLKPAEFVENTWDTTNGHTVFGQRVYSGSGTRFTGDTLVHDENGLQIFGSQQFVVSLLGQNNIESTYLGNAVRNLDVQLGHKMGGFVENTLTLTNDAFSLIPTENSEIILYEGQSIKEEFYSGVIVEWTGKSYKVFGYNLIDPVFPTIPHSASGRKTKITIGTRNTTFEEWAPQLNYMFGDIVVRNNVFYRALESHKSTSTFDSASWVAVEKPGTTALLELVKYLDPLQGNPVVNVAYGQEFATVQDVFTFLHNYERYLISRGWIFDAFDEVINLTKDWTLAGKQFATWSLNQWPVGAFITLSPSSEGLKFKSEQGHIKPIEQITNGVYSILNRNGDRINTSDTLVSRFEDTAVISPTDPTNIVTGIYALRLYMTEFEHALFVSNKTLFGDILYDPIFNSKVSRLRVSMVRSDNWNGRLDAPGYLVSGNTLIPNYEKTVNDFRKYFDIEDQVNDKNLRMYANHNIAYQDRSFLNRLIISEKSQLNFYQGMIQQKGTSAALNKLLRSDFVTRYSDISLYEEWAFREGHMGAYAAQPTIELRIPNDDYDRDPQLIEFKEVKFSDVIYPDLVEWRYDYQNRNGILPSELNSDWDRAIWDDWFDTFFVDNTNDSTITTYVVLDDDNNVVAGDKRWESIPTRASVFPMVDRPLPTLPTAGYMHVNEYDHVFRTFVEMSRAGTYLEGARRYNDGEVIWIYNNFALEPRTFTLDEAGNNVIGQTGTDEYTGMTSNRTSWSVYRMVSQPWIVASIKTVNQTNFYEIETTEPHGLKLGEVIVVYDSTSRTIIDNQSPIVINSITSQYKFRIPKDVVPFVINAVDDTTLTFLKMVETRFESLAKTSNSSYSVQNYISNNNFKTSNSDLLWVDNGVDLETETPTGGWVTYNFDWFSEENYDNDIVYAKVPMNFTQPNWQTKVGFDAQTMSNKKFILGQALVDKLLNDTYLIKNTSTVSNRNDFDLAFMNQKLNVSINNEWHSFVDYVSTCSEIALYASYIGFNPIRKEALSRFEGRFFTGYVTYAAGFSNMDKTFRIAPKQKTAPISGSYWIFVDSDGSPDDDAVMVRNNGVWSEVAVNVGDNFWDPISKTMLVVETTGPLTLTTTSISDNQAWFDEDIGIPYLIENGVPVKVIATDYYWYDTEPTSPSGVWKELIEGYWTTLSVPNGVYVYDIIAKKVYTKVSDEIWADVLITEDHVVFCRNNGNTFKGIDLEQSEPLEQNEFIFDGTDMYLWDGAMISIVSYSNNERWIANTDPVYIDTSKPNKYVKMTLTSGEFWFNAPLGLVFQYSLAAFRFSRLTPSENEIWSDGSLSYIYSDAEFKPHTFNNGEFNYDFVNNKMYVVTNGVLADFTFNSYTYYWLNGETLYSSKNMKSLTTVVFKNGDYIFNNNQFAQYNGVEFIATTLATGIFYSTIDNRLYFWNGSSLPLIENGLYFSTRLLECVNTEVDIIVPATIGFTVTDFKQVVGTTPTNESLIFDGEVEYPTLLPVSLTEYTWEHLGPIVVELRRELQKVDSSALTRTLIYDVKNNIVDADLFIYDPVKGLIPGIADKEIWFKTDMDPATYNTNILNNYINKSRWGSKQVGQTWWDLSTVKYLDYEMDDLEYRRNYWGALAPLASIDIYEWVESQITPTEYAAQSRANRVQNVNDTLPTGTPYSVDNEFVFNLEEIVDESENIKTVYYFWVRNKQTLPVKNKTQYNRQLTTSQLSQIIEKPTENGIIWAAPIDKAAMIFANVSNYLTGQDSVLQINVTLNQNDGELHKQFVLGRENDPNWNVTNSLWERMSNSLITVQYFWKHVRIHTVSGNNIKLDDSHGLQSYGLMVIDGKDVEYTYNGDTVNIGDTVVNVGGTVSFQVYFNIPDDKLPESQKYGNLIRPRQSWFKHYKGARGTLVENINNQLRQVWITRDRFDWDENLYLTDPEPTDFTLRVNDLQERDLALALGNINVGDQVLVAGNIETNYYWTLWELTSNGTWIIYKAQMYRVRDFWEFADYYDVSVNPLQEPLRIFRDMEHFEFNEPNIEFVNGELIKILNVGDNTWEWRRYEDGTFITVAKENATIAFKNFDSDIRIILDDHFYKISSVNVDFDFKPFWDVYAWDTTTWDNEGFEFKTDVLDLNNIESLVDYIDSRDGTLELSYILHEIRNNRILNIAEQNNLFFSLINYAHVEHNVIDWAFKTSYISISGYTEQLEQVEIMQPDMTNALFDYIEESKPYHTKIRNFLRQVNTSDEASVCVTDFDKPVYLDGDEYRVLSPVDDADILCAEGDCVDQPYQFYAKEQGICGDNISHSSLIRNVRIVQKFDRVSCDETAFLPNANWDMNAWDTSSWDYNMTVEDLANEPFIFRVTADGESINWRMVSANNSLFYNVKTKETNKTENLLYYVVPGYVPDRKWASNIEKVVIKDLNGFERTLNSSQWFISERDDDLVLNISTIPTKGQIVELTRNLSEYDRIIRMYRSFNTTKLGNPVTNIIPSIAPMKNCDFNGTVVDGGKFSSGWDTKPWDENSINILARPKGSATNRFIGEASTNDTLADYWIDTNALPINQLKEFDGTSWESITLVNGDWYTNIDNGDYLVWTGSVWASLISSDGWDSTDTDDNEISINSGDMSEWEIFSYTGIDVIELTQKMEYGAIGFVVVYVNNLIADNTDYTFDINTGELDLSGLSLVNDDIVAVYKVFDFNDTGIIATFSSGANGDPWNTLIDGGDFVQPWIGPNRPEELAYLKINDTLIIDVMNQISTGLPFITNNRFIGDGTPGPFNLITPIQSHSENQKAVFVYNFDKLISTGDYTIDMDTMTITFTSDTIIGEQYLVQSFSDDNITLWDTFEFTNTSEFTVTDIPVVNKLVVIVDGKTTSFEVDGPTFTAEQLANGVTFAIDDFTITTDLEGTDIEVQVWVNQIGSKLFGFEHISTVETIPLIAGVDVVDLNVPVTNLGPNENMSGTATIFPLSQLVNEDVYQIVVDDDTLYVEDDEVVLNITERRNWDEFIVHINGLRIPGPRTLYMKGDGYTSCYDVPHNINYDNFVVLIDNIPVEATISTKPVISSNLGLGLTLAETLPVDEKYWNYLDAGNVWDHAVQLTIDYEGTTVVGDIQILDIDNDGAITMLDLIESFENGLADPMWDDVRTKFSIENVNGRVEIVCLDGATFELKDIGGSPIVNFFFNTGFAEVTVDTIRYAIDSNGKNISLLFATKTKNTVIDLSNQGDVSVYTLHSILSNADTNIRSEVLSNNRIRFETDDGYLVIQDTFGATDLSIRSLLGSWIMSNGSTKTSDGYNVCLDNAPPVDSDIKIGLFAEAGFEIHDDGLYVTQNLVSGDDVTVVRFNTPDEFNIHTDTFDGNAVGEYRLSQTPLDGDHTWVTINGERKIYNVHYNLLSETKGWDNMPWDHISSTSESLANTTNNPDAQAISYGFTNSGWDNVIEENHVKMTTSQTDTDVVIVTSFNGVPAMPSIAFRMFKTTNDNWEFIRISDAHKTILKANISSDIPNIEVWENINIPDYMKVDSPLMLPNKTQNIPGVIWIGQERVKYWGIEEQIPVLGRRWWKLSELERGTLSTSSGSDEVIDILNYEGDGSITNFAISPNASNTVVTVNGVIRIAFDQAIQDQVTAGTYESNSGFWNWDYEIINNEVVFRHAPTGDVRVYMKNITNIAHTIGTEIIDGNVNQRIPNGYYWKWDHIQNKGLQLNGDEISTFLLNRPGSIS